MYVSTKLQYKTTLTLIQRKIIKISKEIIKTTKNFKETKNIFN